MKGKTFIYALIATISLFLSYSAFSQITIGTPGNHTFTVPISGNLTLTVKGADGGNGGRAGGSGATITSTFALQVGDILTLVVGGAGQNEIFTAGGGGGGSAVILTRGGNSTLLIVAGGAGGGVQLEVGGAGSALDGTPGGGSGSVSSGGGGFNADGNNGNFVSGGKAGTLQGGGNGGSGFFGGGGFGFGGGGGGSNQGVFGLGGGGGGGYGGGSGTGGNAGGMGGSSFVNASGTNISRVDGTAGGGTQSNGFVTLSGALAIHTVSISATDANAAETSQDPGTFRISRSVPSTDVLNVSYTVGGTATNGTDYTPMLSGTATIPANASFVDITITPVDDAIYEGNETVTLTLVDETTYDLGATTSATVTIAENEAVPMYASADFTLDNEYFINNPSAFRINNIKDQYGNPYVPGTVEYQMDANSGINFSLDLSSPPPYNITYTYTNPGSYTIKVFIDNVEAYSTTIEVNYIPVFTGADFEVSPPAAPFSTPVTATISNLKDQFNNPYTPGSVKADVLQSNIPVTSVPPTGSGAGPYNAVYNNLAVGDYEVEFYVDNVLRETKSFSVVCPVASTLYVNAANNNVGDGTDWNTAFNKLQDALSLACNCGNISEIWVAAGTYYPDEGINQTDNDRNSTFQLCNGVALYGGFNGTEMALADRNVTANVTTLSGDIDGNDLPFDPDADDDNDSNTSTQTDHIRGDNAYHVVTGSGTNNSALLDGFTITAGYDSRTTGNIGHGEGAGMINITGSPTIAYCDFIGNYAYHDGAGMYNLNGSNIVLSYCNFRGNSARTKGGGMGNELSSPELSYCTFSKNFSEREGGGMSNVRSSPTLTHCSFNENISNLDGGGMYSSGSSSPVLTDCSFTGNTAADDGGGVEIYGDCTLTNCTFTQNSSGREGGGIYASGGTTNTILRLTNCTFTRNSAKRGGGVSSGWFSILINCSFLGNTAIEHSGGMLGSDSPSCTLVNCNFSGNKAGINGGGLHIVLKTATLINCSFSGNKAAGSGGGIFTSFSDLSLTNCIIWNNQDNSGTNTAEASIYGINSNTIIASSLIANSGGSSNWNTALGIDGGDNKDIDPLFVTPVDPAIAPTATGDLRLLPTSPAINMGDNAADLDGAGPGTTTIADIATDLAGNARILEGIVDMGAYEQLGCPSGTSLTLYVNATAANGGDGLNWNTAFNKLQDALTFACNCGNISEIWVAAGTYYPDEGIGKTDNDRNSTFQLCNSVKLYGGFSGNEDPNTFDLADRDFVTNVTILSGDIDKNNTLDNGNAYHVVTGSGTDGTAVLDGFTVKAGNADFGADDLGGGMYNNNGSPNVSNCTFADNNANRDGGGMYNTNNSSPTVATCTFSSNRATNNDGGGMCNTNSSPTVTNCTFLNNNASRDGGGMCNTNNSSPTVTKCIFSSNRARNNGGGGMSNRGNSSPTVANCTFSENSTVQGGGIYNIDGSPTITNCTFSGNSVSNAGGGGMYNQGGSPKVANCIFLGNRVSNDKGGGMHNNGSTLTVTNCTFSGNTANVQGGGMYNNGGSVTVTNTTIWNNRANNVTGTAQASIFNDNSTPIITYSLIQNITTNSNNNKDGITNAGNSNYPAFVTPVDPTTAPTTAGNLRLQPASPAINVGDNSVVTVPPFLADVMGDAVDLDGNKRIVASTVDMGAYESPCPTITAEIAGTTGICPSGSINLTVSISGGTIPYTVVYSPDGGTTQVTVNDYESGDDIAVMPGASTTYTLISVTDANGCVATSLSGSAVVTVEDVTDPVFACNTLSDLTQANDAGKCEATVTIKAPQAMDNCDGTIIATGTRSDGKALNDPYPVGMTTITWTFKDKANNSINCQQKVIISDAEKPVFNCNTLSDLTQANDAGKCEASVTINAPQAMDNCDGTVVATGTRSDGKALNDPYPVGMTTITWTFKDKANNSINCEQKVIISDTEKPVANCKAATITLNANGTYTLQASEIDNNSSDNCGITKYTLSKTNFTCADIGKPMVTLTVEDANGLKNECMAEVTILASAACEVTIVNTDGPTIKDPCTCSNISGLFDEEIIITSNAANENWELSVNNGLLDPANNNQPFATGTPFQYLGLIDNKHTYSLVGRHQSGVGYNITATSSFYPNDPQTTSNKCDYPSVEAGNAITICQTKPVNLVGVGQVANATSIWSTSGDGQFVGGTKFGETTAYLPGVNDKKAGKVTLTLTADSDFTNCDFGDQLEVTILKVDCGQFPWKGN